MAAGRVFTVIIVEVAQPVPIIYEIIVVPIETPVTIPVTEPIAALPGDELAHEPPEIAFVKVIAEETHTEETPVMGNGAGLIVSIAVAIHPVLNI